MRSQRAISVYFPFIAFLSDLALAAVVFVGARQVARRRHDDRDARRLRAVPRAAVRARSSSCRRCSTDTSRPVSVCTGSATCSARPVPSSGPTSRDDLQPIDGHLRGELRLRDVGFRYPGADSDALTDIDLHIPAGDHRRPGRRDRRRQVDHRQTARPLLRPDVGRGARRRRGPPRRSPRRVPRPARRGPPGSRTCSPAPSPTTSPTADPTRADAEIEDAARAVGALGTIADIAGWDASPHRRARARAVGGPAPAHRARPRRAGRPRPAAARRSDRDARSGHRAGSARGEQPRDPHPDVGGRGPPSGHRCPGRRDRSSVDRGRIVETGSHATLRYAGGHYSGLWDAAETGGGE